MSFLKKYNKQVKIEKTFNQAPAESITNITRGTLQKNVDILATELHQQPQMFYTVEVKICPLKT